MKMTYKIIAMILLLTMIGSLVACSTTEEKPTETQETTEQPPSEETTEEEEASFSAILWSANVPEELVLDEENARDEESYASQKFEYWKDPSSEYADASISISISIEDSPRSFRRLIANTNAELKDYADGVDTVEIGGISFTKKETVEWFSDVIKFNGRDEDSAANISITITGDIDADIYQPMLDSFKLTVSDTGHVDPPWPWDGVRYEPEEKPVMSGTFTITPEYLEADEPIILNSIMDTQIAVVGNSVYVVTNTEMSEYLFTEDKKGLTFNKTEVLDTSYEHVSCDNAGNLYMSPGLGEIAIMNGFEKTYQSTLKYDLAIHPSGTWGISFWVNSDPMKVTVGDGVMGEEAWVLKNLNKEEERVGLFSMISQIEVNDNHIIVAGKHVEKESETIVVYDTNGNVLFTLADTETDRTGLGSVTGVVETDNGFLATDGNMRQITLWNKEGAFIGQIAVKDLLGASYCWLEDVQKLADGSIILAISQTREDQSADELTIYRLTGF